MPRGNTEHLKPFVKGDPRIAEINKKKGEALALRNAKRKAMKEDLNLLLKLSLKRGELVTADDVLNFEEAKNKNITVQTAILVAMVQRALMGDVQAATYIRDTVGEKPSDKVEIDQSLTLESWAKRHKVKL